MKISPPKLAQRILLRFLRDDLAEEVLGDLDEKFYSTMENKSIRFIRAFGVYRRATWKGNQYPACAGSIPAEYLQYAYV